MSDGVIVYNIGTKMFVRLCVMLHSLREHYEGNVSIIADSSSINTCKEIADKYSANVVRADFPQLEKNTAYLNACLMHTVTPYDNTLWIDSDCLVLNRFSEVFDYIKESQFVIAQFSDWTTYRGLVHKRIKSWGEFHPDMVEKALSFGPAINCGVFGFSSESQLAKDWYDKALPGKMGFIPDETCCQLMLPFYPHRILDPIYNTSCKFGDITDETKIVHFHGRKHCRVKNGEFLFNSDKWYKKFEEVNKDGYVEEFIQYDRQLRKHIIEYRKMKDKVMV